MKKLLAKLILIVTGWKQNGECPMQKKFVLIAAPHTSNWDFIYMMCFASIYSLKISWMGKHTLFRNPILNKLFRKLGGIPVFRNERRNMVQQMANAFTERDNLILAIPPEGTRKRSDYWKSGFYHIANQAKVPVVMSFLDYKRKQGGFGPVVHLTGDIKKDMDQFRAFYSNKTARHPHAYSPIRLQDEEN